MTPDLKTNWLAALRSGDFKQGTGHLRSAQGGYCCLGVLCEVAGWPHAESEDFRQGFEARKGVTITIMPDEIALETLGLTLASANCLADMNDRQGYDFVKIAAWIEENL